MGNGDPRTIKHNINIERSILRAYVEYLKLLEGEEGLGKAPKSLRGDDSLAESLKY